MRTLAIWLLTCAAVFGQTAISNLPNTTTAEPSDRTAVWMVLDDTAVNQTRKINLRQLNLFIDVRKTTGAITATGNSWSDPVLKDFVRDGQWIVVNAFTSNAEMRLITDVTVNTITVQRPFVRNHSIGSTVVISDSAERNVKWWGALGDKTNNDAPAIQAALNDFDTQILASRESRGNNLFFPPGEYVIGSTIIVPVITPYGTSRQSITGHNATLITTSFNGPFFSSRKVGTDNASVAATNLMTDTTRSFATNELVGGFIFNLTDGTDGTITANTATTVTNSVLQGEPNITWDSGDSYLITVPSSKWVFHNLHFRDDTAGFPNAGNAHLFDWSLFRTVFHNCTVATFDTVFKSDDLANTERQYLQSARITNNIFDSCKNVVKVSKAWDFLFADNLTDSCANVVVAAPTLDSGMVQGTIRNNSMQGAGAGQVIHIRGGRGVSVINNYFESNNTGDVPYIDMRGGQQPRGIQISGNHIELHDNQKDDASYYPVALNSVAEGVTIFANQSEAALVSRHPIPNGLPGVAGAEWTLFNNHTLFGPRWNSAHERLSLGGRAVQRMGYVQTTNDTPTRMQFNGGAPLFSKGDSGLSSVYSIHGQVVAMTATGAGRASATYVITALYEDNSGTFTQVGATAKQVEIEDLMAWDATFALVNETDTLSAVDATADTLDTAAAHGLSENDTIFFTGTLPAPLIANTSYYAEIVDSDTIKVRRGPAVQTIDLTNTTLSGAALHKVDIHVEVTGHPTSATDWWGDFKILIGPD